MEKENWRIERKMKDEYEYDWEELRCDWCNEIMGFVNSTAGVTARYYHNKVICSKCRSLKLNQKKTKKNYGE